jgi:hypothetical protein
MRKDSEWSVIDGDPCKVIEFTPLATIENGKVVSLNKAEPYASVILECKKLPGQTKGFIFHKMDFIHLWVAFKDRGVSNNEEVIIIWSTKHYRYKFLKSLSIIYPKIWVMIWPKGTWEVMVSLSRKPELTDEAIWNTLGTGPLAEWKPEIME